MEIRLRNNATNRVELTASDALHVEFAGDVACPFSYLGLTRLQQALLQLETEQPPVIRWQAFQVHPELPHWGMDFDSFLSLRFGGRGNVKPALAQITELGRECGITFDFGRISQVPNTLDAHRLLLLAQDEGKHIDLADRLFRAVFAQGLNIGDTPTLARLAAASGLDFAKTKELLGSDAGRRTVQAIDTNLRLQGVHAVPYYVFNGRVAVAGVQDVDTLVTALDYALFQPMPDIGDRTALH